MEMVKAKNLRRKEEKCGKRIRKENSKQKLMINFKITKKFQTIQMKRINKINSDINQH